MQRQKYRWNEMTMGTCYYPEHWDASLWESDLTRMLEAGISVIRIAEFAWNKMEPEEGHFTWDFFQNFLDLCQEKGMKVILGTPTATPPAWLTEKYPEVLNAREDGVLYRHGGRKHYNYNSPVYQRLAARITEEMAKAYGQHPAVVGWQIDNELNCETNEFHSEADSAAFREFLKEKYGSLTKLNEAWGTVFWNETYTDWEQIYVPRPLLGMGYNPHLHLDYFRFISESTLRFCRMEADIVRRYKKEGDFITTNGLFGNVDNHRMENECLDVYTYDSYPNFAYGLERNPKTATDLNDRHWTKNLTEVRSVCPHFGIMEQQAGAGGWTTRMESTAPKPGQLTLWAMQSVAQGADYISFFRWRTCTFGTEIYWHGILDYDSRDNRKLAEVKDFYRKLKTLDPVCGAKNVAAFGVLTDYDNIWDSQVDAWHRRVLKYSEEQIFEISELTHTPYDLIYLNGKTELEELSGYPVLFYPHPVIVRKEMVSLLKVYVEQGGTLILGCRSGYKQENGKCVMLPQPGLFAELTGSDVRDFTFVNPAEGEVSADWNGQTIPMPVFNDIMETAEGAENARVLAVYENGCYQGKAALIENFVGKGRVLHLGSAFCRENVRQLLAYTGILEPFANLMEAPEGVETVLREKDGRQYLFLLNFQKEPQTVLLKKKARLLYDGSETEAGTKVTLEAYGTGVYEIL